MRRKGGEREGERERQRDREGEREEVEARKPQRMTRKLAFIGRGRHITLARRGGRRQLQGSSSRVLAAPSGIGHCRASRQSSPVRGHGYEKPSTLRCPEFLGNRFRHKLDVLLRTAIWLKTPKFSSLRLPEIGERRSIRNGERVRVTNPNDRATATEWRQTAANGRDICGIRQMI